MITYTLTNKQRLQLLDEYSKIHHQNPNPLAGWHEFLKDWSNCSIVDFSQSILIPDLKFKSEKHLTLFLLKCPV